MEDKLTHYYELSKAQAAKYSKLASSSNMELRHNLAARTYFVMSTLLFTSVNSVKLEEYERFVIQSAKQLPTSMFNWDEWDLILKMAKQVRSSAPSLNSLDLNELKELLRDTLPPGVQGVTQSEQSEIKRKLIPILQKERSQLSNLKQALRQTEKKYSLLLDQSNSRCELPIASQEVGVFASDEVEEKLVEYSGGTDLKPKDFREWSRVLRHDLRSADGAAPSRVLARPASASNGVSVEGSRSVPLRPATAGPGVSRSQSPTLSVPVQPCIGWTMAEGSSNNTNVGLASPPRRDGSSKPSAISSVSGETSAVIGSSLEDSVADVETLGSISDAIAILSEPVDVKVTSKVKSGKLTAAAAAFAPPPRPAAPPPDSRGSQSKPKATHSTSGKLMNRQNSDSNDQSPSKSRSPSKKRDAAASSPAPPIGPAVEDTDKAAAFNQLASKFAAAIAERDKAKAQLKVVELASTEKDSAIATLTSKVDQLQISSKKELRDAVAEREKLAARDEKRLAKLQLTLGETLEELGRTKAGAAEAQLVLESMHSLLVKMQNSDELQSNGLLQTPISKAEIKSLPAHIESVFAKLLNDKHTLEGSVSSQMLEIARFEEKHACLLDSQATLQARFEDQEYMLDEERRKLASAEAIISQIQHTVTEVPPAQISVENAIVAPESTAMEATGGDDYYAEEFTNDEVEVLATEDKPISKLASGGEEEAVDPVEASSPPVQVEVGTLIDSESKVERMLERLSTELELERSLRSRMEQDMKSLAQQQLEAIERVRQEFESSIRTGHKDSKAPQVSPTGEKAVLEAFTLRPSESDTETAADPPSLVSIAVVSPRVKPQMQMLPASELLSINEPAMVAIKAANQCALQFVKTLLSEFRDNFIHAGNLVDPVPTIDSVFDEPFEEPLTGEKPSSLHDAYEATQPVVVPDTAEAGNTLSESRNLNVIPGEQLAEKDREIARISLERDDWREKHSTLEAQFTVASEIFAENVLKLREQIEVLRVAAKAAEAVNDINEAPAVLCVGCQGALCSPMSSVALDYGAEEEGASRQVVNQRDEDSKIIVDSVSDAFCGHCFVVASQSTEEFVISSTLLSDGSKSFRLPKTFYEVRAAGSRHKQCGDMALALKSFYLAGMILTGVMPRGPVPGSISNKLPHLFVHIWLEQADCLLRLWELDQAMSLISQVMQAEATEASSVCRDDLMSRAMVIKAKILLQWGIFDEAESLLFSVLRLLGFAGGDSSVTGSESVVEGAGHSNNVALAADIYLALCELNRVAVGTKNCAVMLSTALSYIETIPEGGQRCVANSQLQMQRGCILLSQGRFEQALISLEETRDDTIKLCGAKHWQVLQLSEYIIAALVSCCRYSESIVAVEDLRVNLLSCGYTSTLKTSDLDYWEGLSLLGYGRIHDAKQSLTRCLNQRKEVFYSESGGAHHSIAACLCALGRVEVCAGEISAGARSLEAALAMRTKVLGSSWHAASIESLLYVALAAEEQELLQEASAGYQKVLESCRASGDIEDLGTQKHPIAEYAAVRLSWITCMLGDVGEAKAMIGASGKALCSILGQSHDWAVESLHTLAKIYYVCGKYNNAKRLLKWAQKTAGAMYAVYHPLIVALQLTEALNAFATGYYDEAMDACSSILTAVASAPSAVDGVNVILTRLCMLCIRRDKGFPGSSSQVMDNIEAESLDKEFIDIIGGMKGLAGGLSWQYAAVLLARAEFLRRIGNLDDAFLLLNECLGIRTSVFGSDHYLVAEVNLHLALCLLTLGDVDSLVDALELLRQQVVPTLKASLGTEHPLYVYAIGNVGMCLAAQAKNQVVVPSDEQAVAARQACEAKAQKLIDSALDIFDVYQQGPFADGQPWVLQFGGWTSASPRASRQSSPRAAL